MRTGLCQTRQNILNRDSVLLHIVLMVNFNVLFQHLFSLVRSEKCRPTSEYSVAVLFSVGFQTLNVSL